MPANGNRLRRSTQHTCTSVKARCKHVRGSARDLVHPPALACGVQNKRVKGEGARARERARAPAPRAFANTTHRVTHYHTRRGTSVTKRTMRTNALGPRSSTHPTALTLRYTRVQAKARTHTTPYRASKHASPQARTCVHRAHTRRGTSGSTRRPQRRAYAPSSFTPLGCPLWRSATAFCCSDLKDGARTVAGGLSERGR